MKLKSLSIFSIAALVALLGAFVAPTAVGAQTSDDDMDVTNVFDFEVSGSTDDGATFEGTFSVDEFVASDDQLFAVGTLSGELSGDRVEEIDEDDVMIPVWAGDFGDDGLCGDLSFTLGPADIDLDDDDNGEPPVDGTAPDDDDNGDDGEPGVLQVDTVLHLDEISFTVSTEAGLGGAFGKILCNFAGLFGDVDASTLATLLNLFMRFN